jgi:nucleolar pre-ribosomal-associated protein 2
MGVVLGLQRLKVGGRFHLVVHAMQRLLACLFARSRKRTRANRASPPNSLLQPFWLAPLQPSHASHYTRLLTSLCDPTMTAVLRPAQAGASRDALTDQTKKAKRIAGQYLQYVIMEYAQCSLRGSLTPEVKTAIMPGLYATLDVMSRESMRALNAALDVSGRAVFRSLYEDYVKFGKWDKV